MTAAVWSVLTMPFGPEHWFPFIEDGNCNVTGPGHQDKIAFVRLIEQFDRLCGAADAVGVIGPSDVDHAWLLPVGSPEDPAWQDDPRWREADAYTPGAVAVTMVWGVR